MERRVLREAEIQERVAQLTQECRLSLAPLRRSDASSHTSQPAASTPQQAVNRQSGGEKRVWRCRIAHRLLFQPVLPRLPLRRLLLVLSLPRLEGVSTLDASIEGWHRHKFITARS